MVEEPILEELLKPTSSISLLLMQTSVASALHIQYPAKVFLVGAVVRWRAHKRLELGGFEVCPLFKHPQSHWMTMKLSA